MQRKGRRWAEPFREVMAPYSYYVIQSSHFVSNRSGSSGFRLKSLLCTAEGSRPRGRHRQHPLLDLPPRRIHAKKFLWDRPAGASKKI